MATTPLAVVGGVTVPHGAAGQETLHVTPLPAVSPLTVAVKDACCVAITALEPAETETVIWGLGFVIELLPPQPTMMVAEMMARSVRDALSFIDASAWDGKPRLEFLKN